MPNLYFKPVSGNAWNTVSNWFINADASTNALQVPWLTDNIYKTYNLTYATGASGVAFINTNSSGEEITSRLGVGVTTATCSVNINLLGVGEDASFGAISAGVYNGIVTGCSNTGGTPQGNGGIIEGGTFNALVRVYSISNATLSATATVTGGLIGTGCTILCSVNPEGISGSNTFNFPVTMQSSVLDTSISGTCIFNAAVTGLGKIQGGTFNSSVSCQTVGSSAISPAVFNGTLTASGSINTSTTFPQTVTAASIAGTGTFNGAVFAGGITGGTFNGAVSATGNVSSGTFNGAYTQNSGNVSGGIFNGPYTYVSGNLTGGTFGNGTLNSFVRNGFPPPIVFKGRQFWIQ